MFPPHLPCGEIEAYVNPKPFTAILVSKTAWPPSESCSTGPAASESSAPLSVQTPLGGPRRSSSLGAASSTWDVLPLPTSHLLQLQLNGLSFIYQDESEATAGLCGREATEV